MPVIQWNGDEKSITAKRLALIILAITPSRRSRSMIMTERWNPFGFATLRRYSLDILSSQIFIWFVTVVWGGVKCRQKVSKNHFCRYFFCFNVFMWIRWRRPVSYSFSWLSSESSSFATSRLTAWYQIMLFVLWCFFRLFAPYTMSLAIFLLMAFYLFSLMSSPYYYHFIQNIFD